MTAEQESWTPLEALIDDEANPLWRSFEIEVVPTVVFFQEGKPVRRLDGRLKVGLTEDELRRALGL